MLAPSMVGEIRRLLADDKLSQRKIARRTGVSRGTVAAIAAGRRPDYERLRAARQEDALEPTGPLMRCPQCGGKVYLPCRLCHARKLAAQSPKRPRPGFEAAGLIELQLKEEHRLRYEEVLAARRRAEMEAYLEEEEIGVRGQGSGIGTRRRAAWGFWSLAPGP
jgi:transcriptional regulator with XRE-family HTH domain